MFDFMIQFFFYFFWKSSRIALKSGKNQLDILIVMHPEV